MSFPCFAKEEISAKRNCLIKSRKCCLSYRIDLWIMVIIKMVFTANIYDQTTRLPIILSLQFVHSYERTSSKCNPSFFHFTIFLHSISIHPPFPLALLVHSIGFDLIFFSTLFLLVSHPFRSRYNIHLYPLSLSLSLIRLRTLELVHPIRNYPRTSIIFR